MNLSTIVLVIFMVVNFVPRKFAQASWVCEDIEAAECNQGELFCVKVDSVKGRKAKHRIDRFLDVIDELEIVSATSPISSKKLKQAVKKLGKTSAKLDKNIKMVLANDLGFCRATSDCKQGTLMSRSDGPGYLDRPCFLSNPGDLDDPKFPVEFCPYPVHMVEVGGNIVWDTIPYMKCSAWFSEESKI